MNKDKIYKVPPPELIRGVNSFKRLQPTQIDRSHNFFIGLPYDKTYYELSGWIRDEEMFTLREDLRENELYLRVLRQQTLSEVDRVFFIEDGIIYCCNFHKDYKFFRHLTVNKQCAEFATYFVKMKKENMKTTDILTSFFL